MTVSSIEAIFDGRVFQLIAPLDLPPNTRVRLTIEPVVEKNTPTSFLQTARSLNLDGPSDWSTNIDTYLYGLDAHDDA